MADGKGFALSDEEKAKRLAQLRQRLQAATPPTRKFRLPALGRDWRRSAMAIVLLLILLLALFGSL